MYDRDQFGFRFVFILAGAIALTGFFVCLRIRIPDQDDKARQPS
jgi:hypothetical protein